MKIFLKSIFGENILKRVIASVVIFPFFLNASFASTIVVESSTDGIGSCPGASCTLYTALQGANDGDIINFSQDLTITKDGAYGQYHDVSDNNLTIDGATGGHTVILNGNGSYEGMYVYGDNVTINGLHFQNMSTTEGKAAIRVKPAADGTQITNNVMNSGGSVGVLVQGTNTTIDGNLISGYDDYGIKVEVETSSGVAPTNTTIINNDIGTSLGGVLPADPNGDTGSVGGGIKFVAGDSVALPVSTDFGTVKIGDNTISGNAGNGINVTNTGASSWCSGYCPYTYGSFYIYGNNIGVASDGTTAIPNTNPGDTAYRGNGIMLQSYPWSTVDYYIGMDQAGNVSGNIISNNVNSGIYIDGAAVGELTLVGNKIGVVDDGSGDWNVDAGNNYGIGIGGVHGVFNVGDNHLSNYVGGTTISDLRNIISGNSYEGVSISNTNTSPYPTIKIKNNYIGVGADGTTAVANDWYGLSFGNVVIEDPQVLYVGADGVDDDGDLEIDEQDEGDGNVISGNSSNGISTNTVYGNLSIASNYIGTDYTGAVDIGNTGYGVYIDGGMGLLNTLTFANNVISGNGNTGVLFTSVHDVTIDVYGNKIGTNLSGSSAIPNGGLGFNLIASSDVIASIGVVGENPNIISGNSSSGLVIEMSSSNANTSVSVQNNYIGIGSSSEDLGNNGNGLSVAISGTGNTVVIGGDGVGDDSGEGNVISGNENANVSIADTCTVDDIDCVLVRVASNKIGTAIDGSFGAITNGDGVGPDSGIYVYSALNGIGIFGNTIGNNYSNGIGLGGGGASVGDSTIDDNVIVANGGYGIYIYDLYSADTPVNIHGNYIGVTGDGITSVGMANDFGAIYANEGILTIGGYNDLCPFCGGTIGDGNVIAANGVLTDLITLGGDVLEAYFYGNVIGLTRFDEASEYEINAGHGGDAIYVNSPNLYKLVIGGVPIPDQSPPADPSQTRNVISGRSAVSPGAESAIDVNDTCDSETAFGLDGYCQNADKAYVEIWNNYIGMNWSGDSLVTCVGDCSGSYVNSVIVRDGDDVQIGETSRGNVISGTTDPALLVRISSGDPVVDIISNIIGLGCNNVIPGEFCNGEVLLGNEGSGIVIGGAGADISGTVTIGGNDPSYGNIIGGNSGYGLWILDHGGSPGDLVVRVLSNLIGVDANDNVRSNEYGLGITGGTVYLGRAFDDTITTNVISGNTSYGVYIHHAAPAGPLSVEIQGAHIGVDSTGSVGIPNEGDVGVYFLSDIGGDGAGLLSVNDSVIGEGVRFADVDIPNEDMVAMYESSGNSWFSLIPITTHYLEKWLLGSLSYSLPEDPMVEQAQCEDGADNDGDGFIDFGDDPGCTDIHDNDEVDVVEILPAQCEDETDNDGDGLIDLADSGCGGVSDDDETNYACNDGLDNDGDDYIDMSDAGCSALDDDDEVEYVVVIGTQCSDDVDNDLDGLTDLGDPGCDDTLDDNEYNAPVCGDGIIDEGEECDDGNVVPSDGCDELCQDEEVVYVCGNGIIELGEACDDGNVIPMDGCDAACQIEVDLSPVCGNGIEEEGEACDDGNVISDDGCSDACEEEGGGAALIIIAPIVTPPTRILPQVVCPSGTVKQGDSCVDVPKTCDSGYVLEGDNCIEVPVTCETGYIIDGNDCVKITEPPVTCSGDECGGIKETKSTEFRQASTGGNNNVSTTSGATLIEQPEEKVENRSFSCTESEGFTDSNGNSIPDCLESLMPDSQETVDEISKEASDEFVFGLTGTAPVVPTIVNLDRKIVDQLPLILVTYRPNVEVSLLMEEESTGRKLVVKNESLFDPTTGKSSHEKIITLQDPNNKYSDDQYFVGQTNIDKEYKGQISINSPLPVGKYRARLVASDGMKSPQVSFEVASTGMEIKDLQVVEIADETLVSVQPLARDVLSAIEGIDDSGRFVVDEYLGHRRANKSYRIVAKIDSLDKSRKLVYFTYKSVIYASVALSDVSQGGDINIPIPSYVPKGEPHVLTMYVSDLDKTKISSKKSISFEMD